MEEVRLVVAGGHNGHSNDVHPHHYLHHHQSPMKSQRSFSDTDATTDESSQASSSFASSPASSYTECEEVSSLSKEHSSSDNTDAFRGPEVIVVSPSANVHLDEISERAQQLLQREQAPEYNVENYFARPNSSLDPICRSMMMDWAYQILDFSFPPPPSPGLLDHVLNKTAVRRKRTHSIEALHLIYSTFSYIDRISTSNDPDPEQFKLLSMVCLHLAAKTSGLFGNSEHEASWPMRKRHDADRFEQQLYLNSCQSQDLSFSSSPTPCFAACVSENDLDEAREEDCGQTIFSTPDSSSSRLSSISESGEDFNCKPRPSMELLSLSALCSLYGGDVHLDEMVNVEWTVLQHGLQWKLTGVTVFEWLDVLLDLAKLRLPQEWTNFFVDWDTVTGNALAQLETAIERHCFMVSAPSTLSLAAFLNATEEYNKDIPPGVLLLDRNMFEGVLGLCLEDDLLHDIRCRLLQ
mmetsp:Transcript_19864/g.30998  ORF Transcript_19864/g.30998 Transcript_19864/m.30998 type:complete len:465 (-) Transcript_19864:831-2225(-)